MGLGAQWDLAPINTILTLLMAESRSEEIPGCPVHISGFKTRKWSRQTSKELKIQLNTNKYRIISGKAAAIAGSEPPSQCCRQLRFNARFPRNSIRIPPLLQDLHLRPCQIIKKPPAQTTTQIPNVNFNTNQTNTDQSLN